MDISLGLEAAAHLYPIHVFEFRKQILCIGALKHNNIILCLAHTAREDMCVCLNDGPLDMYVCVLPSECQVGQPRGVYVSTMAL